MRYGRLRSILLMSAGVLSLSWFAFRAVNAWTYHVGINQVDRALAGGKYDQAREDLVELARRWPKSSEVQYRLGRCEERLGHADEALSAWARVLPGSPHAALAAMKRARLALEHGQFAEAEAALNVALEEPGTHRPDAYWELARLLRFEGRLDDVRELLRARLAERFDLPGTLRELWELETRPVPVGGVLGTLEDAGRQAPSDDRVWLGRAYLAIRIGDTDDAARWLDRCAKRRPDDPVVWRARLALAQARVDPRAARRAMDHLPELATSPIAEAALKVWLANAHGDVRQERAELEQLTELCPSDAAVLERRIALSEPDHQRVAQLRTRKSELDRARGRYDELMDVDDGSSISHAGELARLAATLARKPEAIAWCDLHLDREPGDSAIRTLRERLVALPTTNFELSRLAHPPSASPNDLVVTDSADDFSARELISPVEFTDDATAVGLDFTFDQGRSVFRQLPETMSGGVGLIDYNGDGWLDVYCVQGGPFPRPTDSSIGDRLFRNRGDGTFEDITDSAGIAGLSGGYGHGMTVGDLDNDGHPDLFVTRWNRYQLLRNRGDGTFEDATNLMGLGGDRDWPTSSALADLDGDGDLDLYVCHYLAWDPEHPKLCRYSDTGPYQYCTPRHFESCPDHLFRNDGDRFVDVTEEAGIVDPDGRGLGVVASDIDGDGLVDLYVANDMTANFLFRNLGGFRFEEVGHPVGVAGNAGGGYQAGMGIARGDLDGDGWLDLAVTNFYGEGTTFYRALGDGLFCDASNAIGLLAPSRYRLGFGLVMFDANNDGRLDLATANGHVTDLAPIVPYAMTAQLLVGTSDGHLTEITEHAGGPWQVPRIGRGLASGDLDNDGRVDLLLLSQGEPLAYLHNQSADGGHWVAFRLEGTESNRDAVGAVVSVSASGRHWVADRFGGGSYQSASDGRLHFGLDEARTIDAVEIRWPSGRVDRHENLGVDTGYLILEGDESPQPLDGYAEAETVR